MLTAPASATPAIEVPDTPPRSAATVIGCGLVLVASALVVVASVRHNADDTGGSPGAIPALAALGIAASVLRWTPNLHHQLIRPVSVRLRRTLPPLTAVIAVVASLRSPWADWLVGPAYTAAVFSTYLAIWGFRRLFLLRRLAILSLLTWRVVANVVEPLCRATMSVPSEIVYRRLAAIGLYRSQDHPWRLFAAMTHRGWIAAAGVALLGVVATREPLSGKRIGTVALSAVGALVLHHAAVLAVPIERYGNDPWTRVVTSCWFEVILAAAIGAGLALAGERHDTGLHAKADLSGRDPVIFLADDVGPRTALRIWAVAVPLTALAVAVAR